MTDDRELLEMAAKAYWGEEIDDVVSVEWGEQDNAILYTHAENQDHNGRDQTYVWNPLADDGDALRLAVKCSILFGRYESYVNAGAIGLDIDVTVWAHEEADPCAATRRAVVRAAAEIGRSMS